MFISVACFAWLLLATPALGARILLAAPMPSLSHQLTLRPLAQQLARRGHQLVLLTTDPAPPHPNITQIDLHDSYDLWRRRYVQTVSGETTDSYTQVDTALDVMVHIFERQMRFPDVAKLLDDPEQRFDLVIAEAWMRPTLALGYRFRAPVIQISTTGVTNEVYEATGSPGYSYLYPDFLRTRLYNLTLWEEARELYDRFRLHRLLESYEAREDAMLQRVFGAGLPPLRALQRGVELLLVNVDPLWDGLIAGRCGRDRGRENILKRHLSVETFLGCHLIIHLLP